MSFSRLQRVLRSRWWVLLLVALIALWIADRLTDYRNEQRPAVEAVWSITFQQQLGETADEPRAARLTAAADLAREVNSSQLAARDFFAPWPVSAIETDERTFVLYFIGRGTTEEQATERADRLFDTFFAEEPFTGILGINDQLAALEATITDLRDQIAELTATEPDPLPGEPEYLSQAQLRGIEAQIAALQQRYNTLQVERLDPIERTVADIDDDAEQVLTELIALQLERQRRAIELGLDPNPVDPVDGTTEDTVDGPTFEEDIEVAFLETQAAQLFTAYEELFFRRIEVEEQYDIAEEPIVRESSLEPVEPLSNQLLALASGLLIAITGLIVADRVRRPLWSALDVETLPPLPEVAPRARRDRGDRPWYTVTGSVPRKAGIQALRASIEGLTGSGKPVIGVTGLAAPTVDVQELSADLAASIAVSGSSVLLIDAAFDEPAELVEFGPGGTTLASLLTPHSGKSADARPAFGEILERLSQPVSGMRALPAGSATDDASDLLARPELGALLAVAKAMFDVVIVSGTSAESPITQVLSQRLDYMLLVGTAGRTTEADIESARREFGERRAQLMGVALLLRPMTWVGRRLSARMPSRDGGHDVARLPDELLVDKSRNMGVDAEEEDE